MTKFSPAFHAENSTERYERFSIITPSVATHNDQNLNAGVRKTLYRIRNEAIRTYPFAHFHGKSVFDDSVISLIQRFWPSDEKFSSITSTGRVHADRRVDRVMISIDALTESALLSPVESMFWSNFSAAVRSREFIGSILDWLWPEIIKVRVLPESFLIYSDLILTEDSVGYEIGPHTDAPSRLVTLLFYVPESGESPEAGTSIYVPRSVISARGPRAIHWKHEDFYELFRAPFLPNSFLGFVVGPHSYHGVEPVERLRTSRRQVQLSIRLKQKSV